jgi:hypothetical protein
VSLPDFGECGADFVARPVFFVGGEEMRAFSLWVVTTTALALAVSTASAQPQQRGMPTMSPLMLLSNTDVQKELKLTSDQVKRVAKETTYQRIARQELRELEEKERVKKSAELNKESEKFVADVLKPEQAKRLRQIALQIDGPQSFGKPEVANELKLTEEQRQKTKGIQEEAAKQIRAMLRPGGDREETMKKRSEIIKATNDKVMSLLTPDQKAMWKEMIGEPFKGEIRFGGGRTSGRPDPPR